jgi:hypothetical protein
MAPAAVIFLRTIGGALGVGLLGAALGWQLAHLLEAAGAYGIDVTAALRPDTHAALGKDQLVLVQKNLGQALRGVYWQVAALGIGTMLCALWLPNKHETHASAAGPDQDEDADDGFAVAASEL